MSLKLKKLKAIEFDTDFTLTPKVTTESKLRLTNLKLDSEEAIENAINIISKCFAEEEQEKVKKFLDENATIMTLYQLQAYLAFGVEDMENKTIEQAKKTAV